MFKYRIVLTFNCVGRPTMGCSYEGVHERTSLMCSSLLLQQCTVYLDCLIWMVIEMGCRWPYNCGFEGLARLAFSLYVLSASIWCIHIDTTAAWKKFCFILFHRSDFHKIDSLLITVYAFARRISMSFVEDEMQLPRYVNLSTNFREPLFRIKMSPF